MLRNVFIILIFSFLAINCTENEKSSEEIIEQVENVIEPKEFVSFLDSIPDSIFSVIREIPFVKEKMERFKQDSIRVVFMCNHAIPFDSDEYHIQILIETEIRFRPVFNFEYQFETKKLFYNDTAEDSLILIN